MTDEQVAELIQAVKMLATELKEIRKDLPGMVTALRAAVSKLGEVMPEEPRPFRRPKG